ncbi:P-loop containing nucleoside triphosphate hydrolase protein [Zopfochytrium polystomum]|nr:P-loop containing nucleoside triphosphate hydrolase protein [Zopfochytrium polystomum]
MSEKETVKVVVRCRPFSDKEKAAGHTNIVSMNKSLATVSISDPRGAAGGGGSSNVGGQAAAAAEPPKTFTFDSVFDETSRQEDVYNTTARPIVDSVLSGYNGTVFAYGQTGTGKTFSMEGVRDVPSLRGIIPNAFDHIFTHIQHSSASTQYLVRATYLEIYNEDIRDLLSPKSGKLELKERADTGVYVKDLSTFVVRDVAEMERLMSFGNKNRSVGATEMNARSSRSHSIFSITVEASEKGGAGGGGGSAGGAAGGQAGGDGSRIRAGKLHLVDLAGSERQSKTGATGDRLKEATKINLSLSALGNVISALVDGKSSHIPYRDSKLTRLLQDSLGGNARTLMIATLSPASYNYDETLSTLRYANRAKNIKNKPKINEDPKDAMLREFQEEIKRLKAQLDANGGEGTAPNVVEEVEEIEEVEEVSGSSGSEGAKSPRTPGGTAARGGARRRGGRGKRGTNGRPHLGIPEQRLAEMAAEVEAERQQILADKDMEESERARLLQEAEARSKELENERVARAALTNKLEQLEKKLLVGGVSLVDREEEQRQEIARRQAELEEQARKERELKRELDEHEEVNLQIEEEYASLQEEKEAKTRKIKKVWGLLMAHRSEIRDLQQEHQREREDLLDTVRELTRELKLRMVVMEAFIPEEAIQMLEESADYDEAAEKWRIPHIAHAGNNIMGKRSLVSGEVVGKMLHRQHESHVAHRSAEVEDDDDDDSLEVWDPLSVFPNVYLSYDVPINEMKKKKAPTVKKPPGARASGASARAKSGKASGRPESASPARKPRPASASARRAPSRAGGGGSAAGSGKATEVLDGEGIAGDVEVAAAPTARGLVSKGRRYA